MEEMRKQQTEEIRIDLRRLTKALMRNGWLIGMTAAVCAVLVLAYTLLFAAPMYQSSALFYVKNSSPSGDSPSASVNPGDLSASRELVDSCLVILRTRQTMDAVMETAGVELSERQIEKRITAAPVDGTEMFCVTVTAPEAQEALKLADAVARILPRQISAVIEGTSVKLVDAPVKAARPESPGHALCALIGLLAGLALAIGFVVLRELLDSTVYSVQELVENCPCPVLAAVPDVSERERKWWNRRKMQDGETPDPQVQSERALLGDSVGFAAAEAYRLLRTKLQHAFVDEGGCRVIGISSALGGEGKSACAVNLAYHMAQTGKRVLLIDCDLRTSSLESRLCLRKTPGLSDYLTGQAGEREILQMCGARTDRQAFHVITAGRIPPDPAELLLSREMDELLARLCEDYDWIILDLPAVSAASDALAVSTMSDAVIMVIRQDWGSCETLNAAVRELMFVGVRVLGVVYNGADQTNARRGVRRREKSVPRGGGIGGKNAGENARI